MTEHEHAWRVDSFASGRGGLLRCECGEVRFPDGRPVKVVEAESGDTNVQATPAIVAPEAASEAISEETLVKIAKASKPGTSPRRWLYLRKKAARKVKAESRRKNRRG